MGGGRRERERRVEGEKEVGEEGEREVVEVWREGGSGGGGGREGGGGGRRWWWREEGEGDIPIDEIYNIFLVTF